MKEFACVSMFCFFHNCLNLMHYDFVKKIIIIIPRTAKAVSIKA